MLRPVLFSVAVIALVAPVRAADPDLTGNWMLSYASRAGFDQNFAIIQVEMKDGKPVASVVATAAKGSTLKVSGFTADGKMIKFKTSVGPSFEGTIGKDGKVAIGNFGDDRLMYRATLTRTDKTEIAANEAISRTTAPTAMTEAQKLNTAVLLAKSQITREKDATKKKELTEKADMAQKEADEKSPALFREVLAKHGDTPFALDAATELLRLASKAKMSAGEVEKLLTIVEEKAAPYGTRYAQTVTLQAVETLASQKGVGGAAVAAATKLVKGLPADTPAAFEARVLTALKTALENSTEPNKDAALKTVTAALTKIESKIDAEYLKNVPPFKPTAFAGRKDTNANQVVVMELFTGAQCPPCVAADVAFDALLKSYKPSELVLIQYHMHIPGPDPLTNPDSVARWDYYRKQFPEGIRGTPSTVFNGKPQSGGGGGMAASENKFKQYTAIIDPLLEKTSAVKVAGKASRTGDKIDVAVEVANGDGEDMKLRLLVVEENVKYTGSNALRFHHQVVRAMPGGADGVAVKDKSFKHTATVDLADVRNGLTKYLDDYAANTRAFPKPDRPMDMKALRVIALVQNDKTREITQALQIEVEGGAVGGGGQ